MSPKSKAKHEGPKGTIKPNPNFNAERACQKLHKAFRGIGTDERIIIEVLTSHDNEQRQEIKTMYKTMYGKDLEEDLIEELGGNFEEVALALIKEPHDLIVDHIHMAFKGAGTDENALIGLLSCRTPTEMDHLKLLYKEKFGSDLEEEIKSDLNGDFQMLMRSLVGGQRDMSQEVDFVTAQKDAQELYDAGVGKNAGTDETTFMRIFNSRSYPQLKEVFEAYNRLAQSGIEEAIKEEFSGDMRDALLAVVHIVKDTPDYFAAVLQESMKGAGTNDSTLIQVIVSRSEIDLADIKDRCKKNYGTDLSEVISEECSGDYRKILLKILDQ